MFRYSPLVAASETGTPVLAARNPIMEKIANPANTLVPQLIRATKMASL